MPLPLLRQITLASLIALGLTACGGSGGSPNPTPNSSSASASSQGASSMGVPSSSEGASSSEAASSSVAPPDLEPAAFSFEPQTDVERGATITSNAIIVSEIDGAAPISISGGAYAINGGDYVQSEGTVENGDSVTVQLTASENFDTTTATALTIGGVSGTFTVSTLDSDSTPNTFSFAPSENQEQEAEVISGTITITGVNTITPLTIENGQYSIDSGDFMTAANQIENNQTLTLKTIAPADAGATKEVTLNVGGVVGVWTVSTVEDTEPPEAAFVFPTPMTATEAGTVIVRGTATDELSTVTSVTLEVSNAGGTTDLQLESEENFATWQETVTLADGENTITVVAEDEFGNVLSDGGSVTVVKQPLEESFPDAEFPIEDPQKLVYDEKHDRVLFGGLFDTLIYSVDIHTGKRSAFLTKDMVPDLSSINFAKGLEIAPGGDELFILFDTLKSEGPGVLRIDLETKDYEVLLTRDSQAGDQPNVTQPASIRLDPDNSDRAFMLDSGVNAIVSLDLTTGVRALISNNDADFSGPAFDSPSDLLIDAANNRALVADIGDRNLYWVDLESGSRTLFLAEGVPESTPEVYISSVATDDISERLYGVNAPTRELWMVDPASGEYKVLSSPELPHGYNQLIIFKGTDLSENGEYLIGVDIALDGLFVVDLKTGERVILSKN